MDSLNRTEPASLPESVWVLVANVISERPWRDPATGRLEWRPGTKQFTAGTKVYCDRPIGSWGWHAEFGAIRTIGLARKSRRWISVVTRLPSLENFRVKREYNPRMIRRLEAFGSVGVDDRARQLLEEMAQSGNATAAAVAVRLRELRDEG